MKWLRPIFCSLWLGSSAVAEEPAAPTSGENMEALAPLTEPLPEDIAPSTPSPSPLLERIEALEERIEQLEAQRPASIETPPVPRVEAPSDPSRLLIPVGVTHESVTTYGRDIRVDGAIEGDVTAIAGSIHVGPTGSVTGDAISVGGVVRVDDGGTVQGDRVSMDPLDTVSNFQESALLDSLYRRLIFFLAFAGTGVLVIGLVPDRIERIAQTLRRRPIRSGFIGAGATLMLAAIGVLFGLTCVGLPVTFVIAAFLSITWLFGFISLCQVLGDRLPMPSRQHGRWLTFLIGSAVLSFVGLLPWVGWLALGASGSIGIGAAVTSRLGAA